MNSASAKTAPKNAPSSKTVQDDGTDRRSYFRLNDHITLEFESLGSDCTETDPYAPHLQVSPYLKMISELHRIESETQHLLKPIADQHRQLGSYLKSVNKRIDCLAKYLVASSDEQPPKPTHEVSLSEGGVAFETPLSVPLGHFVHMKMVLFPNLVGLAAIGKVTYCQPHGPQNGDRKNYRIGVEFSSILESDQQIIAKHIIQEQSRAIREDRESSK